jgi:hypothetical protein
MFRGELHHVHALDGAECGHSHTRVSALWSKVIARAHRRSSARLLNWQISLSVLLIMNLIVIPFFLAQSFLFRKSSRTLDWIVIAVSPFGMPVLRISLVPLALSALPVVTYLILLSFIQLPSGLSEFHFLTAVLWRLTILGTVVLGLVSGFAAATNAWAFLPSKLKHDA